MKKKLEKNIKLYLCFALLCAVSLGVFDRLTLPVNAADDGKVTIRFMPMEGECGTESLTVDNGTWITLPEATREGYIIIGWYEAFQEDGESVTLSVGKPGMPYLAKKDALLSAGWKLALTMSFDACGGTSAEESIVVAQTFSVTLPDASREGFEFTGWYKDEGLNEYAGTAGDDYMPDSDTTFYAGWKAVEDKKPDEQKPDNGQECEIIFDTDGGSEVAPIQAVKGDLVKLPLTEKEGFRFLGWYTEKNGGSLLGSAGEEIEVTDDMTACALWEVVKDEGENGEAGDNTGEGENTGETTGGDRGIENTSPDDENSNKASNETGNVSDEGIKKGINYLETDADLLTQNVEAENSETSVTIAVSDENADGMETEVHEMETQADSGNTVEPVIQTGQISPIPAAFMMAMCGVLLMAYAYILGKKKQNENR